MQLVAEKTTATQETKTDNELLFNIYGNFVRGKFIDINERGSITIKVIYDSLDLASPGDKIKIHRDFLEV